MDSQQTNPNKRSTSSTEKKVGSYEIGQIVYILSSKGQSIIPAMIVEQAIVQTLSGKSVSWKLAMGAADRQKIVDSSNISGEIYSTLNDVRSILQVRLTKFLDDITSQAKKRTHLWYGNQLKAAGKGSEPDPQKIPANGMVDPEDFLLDDLDGTNSSANVRFSEEKEDQSDLSADAQKRRLKSMVSMTDQEAEDDAVPLSPNTPAAFIEGPDGTRIPIRLDI